MFAKKYKIIGSNLVDQNLVIVPNAPPKYTNADWHFNNQQKTRISTAQQELANRILCESQRLIDETRDVTDYNKKKADFELEQRIIWITFLRDESQLQKVEACKEEEALKTYRQRILNAINSLRDKSMKICQRCIIMRENRRTVDMVNDEVDKELRRELTVVRGCQELLDKTLNETTEQIRRIRATIYVLDRNLYSKEKSIQIDDTNYKLRDNQLEMSMYEGKLPLNPFNATSSEWQEATYKSIEDTGKEVDSATQLRSYVDVLLKQVVEDIRKQTDRSNEVFRQRINETIYVKKCLEDVHKETCKQVNEMSRNITALEKEIADKEGYVALTQMRLGNRAHRPGLELCQDSVNDHLMVEMQVQQDTIARLTQMLTQTKATQRYLLYSQMQQEEELNVKTNTLKIDEVDCMTIREGLDISTF